MSDTTYFEQGGITVDTARVVCLGQAYPLREVASATLVEGHRGIASAVVLALVGALLTTYATFSTSAAALVIGVMLLVVAYIAWRFQNVFHSVLLLRNGRETEILRTVDHALAKGTVEAINRALEDAQAATSHDAPLAAS